ncbi:MAG: drug/metabolite-transporting permease [Candidatus Woesebacteria bacterium GW2011_GWB1_38_5b]|uniref:Drug/metabolite-transporting permease n=1 Tax=Candidatus Woesebacteria bacterium GW2011_GWB1_38_5b TaxID=1618569 RepID=A0A0G0NC73_9BACT|nr:MAG: drug/metabolite-transporting permease [Candidatus Woesebacteria bacterium GW2011_GWB1_38_5b]
MFGSLSRIQLAIIALIFANIIWGAAFPIYKWTLEIVPPFIFTFIRFFGGALIVLPFVYKSLRIQRSDIPKLILVSLIGISVQIPLLFFGLKLKYYIRYADDFVILNTDRKLLLSMLLNEKLKVKVLIGTLVSLLGVLAIILRPFIESGGLTGSVLGNFLLFGATVCSVAQALILKRITANNDPLALVFWMFVIGIIPIIPFALYETQTFNLLTQINLQAVIGLLYGIVFAAVIAHYLYAFGIKFVKASEVGIFSYVDPLATIVIAIPLLGEIITPTYILGAILVFLGIFIAEGRVHYHPFQRLRT